MKGRINKAILILLGVVAVVFLSAALSRRREPAYQGKPISWWIRTRNESAFCEIGPQAIPFLIRNLELQDSIFRKAALALWPRLPSIIHKKFIAHEPVSASAMKDAALLALWQFGLEANAATPKLVEMGHKEKDPYLRNFAKYTLAKVAPESPRALAAVIEMINDSNSDIRNSGYLALAHVALQAKPVVPVLMERLKAAQSMNSTDGIYGAAEIDALGRIGPEAKEAVTLLVDVLKSSKMQHSILNALEAIGPNAGEAVPTLVELLRSSEPGVKAGVIQALTAIGPKARLAVPALNRALGDENSVVRIMAAFAIGKIKGDSASAVPLLIKELRTGKRGPEQPGWLVRPKEEGAFPGQVFGPKEAAAWFLGEIGPTAKDALPDLHENLKSDFIWRRMFAARAIWKIAREADVALPVLTEAVNTQDEADNARLILAARFLGEMGPTSKPALPLLLQAMKSNFWVRHQVREALGKVNPEAAAEAGVK